MPAKEGFEPYSCRKRLSRLFPKDNHVPKDNHALSPVGENR